MWRCSPLGPAKLQIAGEDGAHHLRLLGKERRCRGETQPGRCAATAGRDLILAARTRGLPWGAVDDTSATLDETAGSPPLRSPKKRGPLQGCAGDGPRDGGEACVGRF